MTRIVVNYRAISMRTITNSWRIVQAKSWSPSYGIKRLTFFAFAGVVSRPTLSASVPDAPLFQTTTAEIAASVRVTQALPTTTTGAASTAISPASTPPHRASTTTTSPST